MALHWTLRDAWSDTIPLPPHVVLANVATALNDGRLRGEVNDGGFLILRAGDTLGRNSWRPRLAGTLTEVDGQTRVDVVATVHPFVFWFTVFHACMMFGIAWVMGTLAFSLALPRMRTTLDAALRGE
jgi:hypothetical protein